MDASKYSELRERLQKQSDLDTANYEWFRRFLQALIWQIDASHGSKSNTCRSGVLDAGGNFDAGSVGVMGSSYEFALEVRFNAEDGKRLFFHAVPFKATILNDVLTVRCIPTDQIVELTFDESREPAARQKIVAMLDEPVTMAIERALAERASISVR